jgi:hypothetical protein
MVQWPDQPGLEMHDLQALDMDSEGAEEAEALAGGRDGDIPKGPQPLQHLLPSRPCSSGQTCWNPSSMPLKSNLPTYRILKVNYPF